MPECRVIPYFKGFLGELKEILSLGGTCPGLLSDLSDFQRAPVSTTSPPTAPAANSNITTGHSVTNNNPPPSSTTTMMMTSNSSFSALGNFTVAAVNSSTVNNSSSSSNAINNNNNNTSGTLNKNLLGHTGDSNCVKLNSGNNVGPSKSSQSSTESTGPGDATDSTSRGMQTISMAGRSPQEHQRREIGHPPKNAQQKVVSREDRAAAPPPQLSISIV